MGNSIHPAVGFINETNKRIKMETVRSVQPCTVTNVNYSIAKGINHGMGPSTATAPLASVTSSALTSVLSNDLATDGFITNNNNSSSFVPLEQKSASFPTVSSSNSLLAGLIPNVSSTNSLLSGLPSSNSLTNLFDIPGMTPSTSSASLSADSDNALAAHISSSSLATDVPSETTAS